jgi:hypothetical protein
MVSPALAAVMADWMLPPGLTVRTAAGETRAEIKKKPRERRGKMAR